MCEFAWVCYVHADNNKLLENFVIIYAVNVVIVLYIYENEVVYLSIENLVVVVSEPDPFPFVIAICYITFDLLRLLYTYEVNSNFFSNNYNTSSVLHLLCLII